MSRKIMVVDDEDSIVKLITYNLQRAGFETIAANDGREALQLFEQARPDLIILDLMLPGLDGFEICQHLRKKGISTPIIMVTARDSEVDKVLGLELGADDYLTKPFSPRELVSRVKVVLRRAEATSEPKVNSEIIAVGDLVIDLGRHEVSVGGQMVELTCREFDLLHCLVKKAGQVFTRDALLDQVWDYEFAVGTRVVDVYISSLRDKIEKDPQNPKYIKTIRGVGYRFQPME